MAAPVILSALNTPADGLHLAVQLQAPPTGTPQFYAATLPGLAGDPGTEVTATGAGTVWTVAVRSTAVPLRLGYYLAVEDDEGLSNEVAEWLCTGTNLDLPNQIEDALQQVLLDNRPLINRSLQIVMGSDWPDGTPAEVLKVLRGHPALEANNIWPLISVRVHDHQEDLWFGNPYTIASPFRATIYVYMFHQGNVSLEGTVRALGMGVYNVLNTIQHLEHALDSGLKWQKGYVENFRSDVEQVPEIGAYMSIVEMDWSCEVFLGMEV